MDEDDVEASGQPDSFDRRSVLKKVGLGAGVVGLVWTSPRIEGLSLRTDYAQAASAPPPAPTSTEWVWFIAGTGAPHTRPGNPALRYQFQAAPSDVDFGDEPPPFPTSHVDVTRSTNCPTVVDIVWQNGSTGVTKTDMPATPVSGYAFTRKASFDVIPSRRPSTVWFKFTC